MILKNNMLGGNNMGLTYRWGFQRGTVGILDSDYEGVLSEGGLAHCIYTQEV